MESLPITHKVILMLSMTLIGACGLCVSVLGKDHTFLSPESKFMFILKALYATWILMVAYMVLLPQPQAVALDNISPSHTPKLTFLLALSAIAGAFILDIHARQRYLLASRYAGQGHGVVGEFGSQLYPFQPTSALSTSFPTCQPRTGAGGEFGAQLSPFQP